MRHPPPNSLTSLPQNAMTFYMKTVGQMELRNALRIALTSALLVSLVACSSLRVPGEGRRILQNLAAEYYALGKGYGDLKQYDKAIQYYKLSQRNREFRKPAEYQLARMYTFALRWADAEKSFSSLLKEDPNNTDLQASLAYTRAMGGKSAEAEAMYESLVEKNPNNERLLENYIRVLMANNKQPIAAIQLVLFGERFPESIALTPLTTLVSPPDSESKVAPPEAPGGGR
ncbi:MAG: hypothetical protein Ta2A_10820 [Treponemataceae bacterium]|nr:MAG: hypothetical protein Ta2A_10820 [Treponemataceae bacterium]